MTPLWLVGAFGNVAHAEAAIEFKTTGSVTVYVDGRPAARLSAERQRVGGLSAGVHSVEVRGRYGAGYKADVQLPDDTITYASWDGSELRLLRTAWLDEEAVAAQAPAPAPAPQQLPPPQELAEVAPPVTPVPDELETESEQLRQREEALAAAQANLEARIAAMEADLNAREQALQAAEQALVARAAQPARPLAAPPPPPPAPATVAVPPKTKAMTIQAVDGSQVRVVSGDREILVTVEGDRFVISDPSGLEFQLEGE